MGMLGVGLEEERRRRLVAWDTGIGWKDSEYVGVGGDSPVMQNGSGGDCGEEDGGGWGGFMW